MKARLLLLILWLATYIPQAAGDGQPPAQSGLVTNLVEILPYVDKCSKALRIDVPHPLTTNDVTTFVPYRESFGWASVQISGRYDFGFIVKDQVINLFNDRGHSLGDLWREEDIKPLIRPSKITKKQALEMARQCLINMGYTEDKLPPLLPPMVHQWKIKPPSAWLSDPLPFFTVEWRWKSDPDVTYCQIEIDGLRQKVTYFFTMYPREIY